MSVANLCDHIPTLDFQTLVHTVADRYSELNKVKTLN